MRIRRRVNDVLQHAQAARSCRARSPPAPPPATAPRSETAGRFVKAEPPAREASPSTCEATTDDHRLPSRGRNRQEEVKEENENRGKEEEASRSEHEHGHPLHVVCSTRAAPKGEEGERLTEVEEEKRGDHTRVRGEEKSNVSVCKKNDGKGWQCKRAAQPGCSLCQYHLDKFRSYGRHSRKKKPRAAASLPEKSAAARTHSPGAPSEQQKKNKKRTEKRVVSTKPGASDSYYYYSGFGPRWGKRSGNRSAGGVKPLDSGASDQVPPPENVGAAAAAGEEETDDVEEEEDYDCDGESRDGKPPKSRRLSSLL